jgi:virulence factor Mce-like protein
MTRRPRASIAASPVLVGAVTVLVAIVAVFLAYNANAGLPFVPTYDVRAELPGGSNLVAGNEVRVGGFRVGAVAKIRPGIARPGAAAAGQDRDARSIAVVDLKLDKSIEPIAADSRVAVRPRSALGLKYIELTPGRSARKLEAGAAIPLAQSVKPVELDDFFSTFDEKFRRNQRTTLAGYGDALSGRGDGINQAIADLVPFMTHLEPVMRTLSDPRTGLGEFLRQARTTSGQIAPVAGTYASLFVDMGGTFEALTRHPDKLAGALDRLRPTLDTAVAGFPVQRHFLVEAGELARRLGPVADQMEQSLPVTANALDAGTPVLLRAPPFYRRTRNVFRSLDDLARNPNTLLALRDLRRTFEVTTPLLEYVAPYQTVCNYWDLYWTALSEHVSEDVPGGTIQRTNLKSDSRTQDNRLSDSTAEKPVDVKAGQDPQTSHELTGDPTEALHRGAYEPAIDAQGNADCQVGQRGYMKGPLSTGNRYKPNETGGRGVVLNSDLPGLAGPTERMRQLGIQNLRDVP